VLLSCYFSFFLPESFWDWTDWDSQYFKLGGGVLHSNCSGWIWVDIWISAGGYIVTAVAQINNSPFFSTPQCQWHSTLVLKLELPVPSTHICVQLARWFAVAAVPVTIWTHRLSHWCLQCPDRPIVTSARPCAPFL